MPNVKTRSNLFYFFIFIFSAISCKEAKNKMKPYEFNNKLILERANFYYDNNNYESAIYSLDSLILVDSLNGDLFFKRGYSKSMMPDIIGACEDYKRAIRLDSHRQSAYLN